jgi:hydrogenase expression/formation protein HypC
MCLGVPGRLVERRDDGTLPMGIVDFGGVRRAVCLAYVADEAAIGDYVVVHAGFAITRVDEDAARRTLALLRVTSGLEELLGDGTSGAGSGERSPPRAGEG